MRIGVNYPLKTGLSVVLFVESLVVHLLAQAATAIVQSGTGGLQSALLETQRY